MDDGSITQVYNYNSAESTAKVLLVFPENLCYNAKLKCSAQVEQAIHI